MALSALAIDVMLAALPDIAGTFSVAEPNDRQLVVTSYLAGFALGQPLHGPLSDRFGRRPVLVAGLFVFAVGAVAAAFAPEFGWLLLARGVLGFGAAAPRVVATAVVRDRFAGREMARIMSFVMIVFIVVPIFAPSVGGAILAVGTWHWIFGFLCFACVGALVWAALRLPETVAPEDRVSLSGESLAWALRTVLTSRQTVGYTIALGFMFGSLMSYIGAAQQIFVDVYGLGRLFPVMFGAIASVVAVASLVNSRLVGRFGMRRLSHAALLGYLAACGALAVAGFPRHPPLPVFVVYLAAVFFFFGLIAPNFNAIAMEPMGRVAGMASSVIGFYMTAAAALFGWFIGQGFDGSVRPLIAGFAALGLLTLMTVLVTERGALMSSRDRLGSPSRD